MDVGADHSTPFDKAKAATVVADALVALRKASDALHDRDKPDTQVATNAASGPQQRVFAAADRLDRAVAAYTALR